MPLPKVPETYEAGYIDRLDRRYRHSAEMQARYREYTDDLGGASALSYAERSLVERALWLEFWLADQERQLAEGDLKDFDVGKWVQATNSLQGIFTRLGLHRRQKDVTDITDFLAQRGKEAGHV
ncbi:hypothetical protein [Actibacterium sp. XHP0104]|uniref:hypothetical protein n=1 Tax=Actibacterium sp. XHP0104 TaxID=2984335 RepID=UPI0021E901CF|nr:hypothetical protein [Actibacterium sp. XHP0104]MCV2881704.1 hypothetical protein [Actibacterium sp. XHP0104]